MDSEYLSRFTNREVGELLLDREKIPILEELIEKTGQQLKEIKNQGKLDSGPYIPEEKLQKHAVHVYDQVDKFLGVQRTTVPEAKYEASKRVKGGLFDVIEGVLVGLGAVVSIGLGISTYFSQNPDTVSSAIFGALGAGLGICAVLKAFPQKNIAYDIKEKEVIVGEAREAELSTHIGHEYTHHVQMEGRFHRIKHEWLVEGMARAVEREIGRKYSEEHGSQAGSYDALKRTHKELKKAHRWMRKNIDRRFLGLRVRSRSKEKEKALMRGPSCYAMGNALLSIYEHVHGAEVHKQIIHEEFKPW